MQRVLRGPWPLSSPFKGSWQIVQEVFLKIFFTVVLNEFLLKQGRPFAFLLKY